MRVINGITVTSRWWCWSQYCSFLPWLCSFLPWLCSSRPWLFGAEWEASRTLLPSASCKRPRCCSSRRTSRGCSRRRHEPHGSCMRASCGTRRPACCCQPGVPAVRTRRASCGTSGFGCKMLGHRHQYTWDT